MKILFKHVRMMRKWTHRERERDSKFALSFSRYPIGGSIYGQTKVSMNTRSSEMCSRKPRTCSYGLYFFQKFQNFPVIDIAVRGIWRVRKHLVFSSVLKMMQSRRFRSTLTEIFMQWKFRFRSYTHQSILVTFKPSLVKKYASVRNVLTPPQLHDWKKSSVILKPQNFHGSENFLEMILSPPTHLEVLYYWSLYRFSYTNEGNRVNFAMGANCA
jgi:hypothetical protein